MDTTELFNFLIEETNHPFSGWDFSHISATGRMAEAPLAWSYTSTLLPRLRKAGSLLDMGTGGGEFLASLQPLPPLTCATEGYAPNVPIARQRLEPLGIKVSEITDEEHIPFEDNFFDLVINRHEYYPPLEVKRVLKASCQFITQQVGGLNEDDLNEMLGGEPYPYANWTLDVAVNQLEEAGFRIREQKEDRPVMRFFDVGAIVYYLKAVPWQIPDFSVEKYFDKLVAIYQIIQAKNYLDVHMHRFLIVAQKP